MKNILIALSCVFFVLSCTKTYSVDLKNLSEKKLNLVAINDKNISLLNSRAYLTLKNNSFKAFSGCNNFTGTYRVSGGKIDFKINDVDVKVCKYIDIQHQFLDNLVKSKYIIDNKNLIYFKDLNKKTLLIFKKS